MSETITRKALIAWAVNEIAPYLKRGYTRYVQEVISSVIMKARNEFPGIEMDANDPDIPAHVRHSRSSTTTTSASEAARANCGNCGNCGKPIHKTDDKWYHDDSDFAGCGMMAAAMPVPDAGEIDHLRSESWNAKRVIEWMDDPNRKPAIHAFTAGNERQIAYRFERVVADAEEVGRLRGEVSWLRKQAVNLQEEVRKEAAAVIDARAKAIREAASKVDQLHCDWNRCVEITPQQRDLIMEAMNEAVAALQSLADKKEGEDVDIS
jgi:hypothetical protein